MLIQCPYKDCTHMGLTLTNHHCITAHGMDKATLVRKYGKPREHHERNDKITRNKAIGY